METCHAFESQSGKRSSTGTFVLGLLFLLLFMVPLAATGQGTEAAERVADDSADTRTEAGIVARFLKASPAPVHSEQVLSVTKTTLTDEMVVPGDPITYHINYTITGTVPVSNVVITDRIPGEVNYVSCWIVTGSNPCFLADNLVIWFLGDKQPSDSGVVGMHVVVKPSVLNETPIYNRGYIFGNGEESAISNAVTHTVESSHSLAISKSGRPVLVEPGGLITYTIDYTVTGNEPALSVLITDAVPVGTSYVGCGPADCGGGAVSTWTLGTLTPTIDNPVTGTVLLTVQVDGSLGTGAQVINKARIYDEQGASSQATETTDVGGTTLIYLPIVHKLYPPPPPVSNWHRGNMPSDVRVYHISICRDDCKVVYAGTNDGVYRSDDGGKSWAAKGLNGEMVRRVAISQDDCATAYATTWGEGVHKTTTGGDSWMPSNNGLANLYLYTLAIDPSMSQVLYAGTAGNGVYKSTNGGNEWFPTNSGLPGGISIRSFIIDPDDTQTIYVGTWGYGIYASSDGGSSWLEKNMGLGDLQINAMAIDPIHTEILYTATYESGVYRSENGGDNWAQNGLPGQIAYTVAVREDGIAYAGTNEPDPIYERASSGQWGPMSKQPASVSEVRSLAVGMGSCSLHLLAGTTDGAWWYGLD